jgi:hypothetical protein
VAELSKRTMFTQVLDCSIEGSNPADRKVVVSLSAYADRKSQRQVRIRPYQQWVRILVSPVKGALPVRVDSDRR